MAILNNSMAHLKPATEAPAPSPQPSRAPLGAPDQEQSLAELPKVTLRTDEEIINAEQLRVSANTICVTLINDLNGRNAPFAELRLADMKLDLKGWSSTVCY